MRAILSLHGNRSGYLPSLDGWRAIAVLSVILYHDSPHSWTKPFYRFGDFGVDLFFAISGILICSRLLEEETFSGRISLRGFSTRRMCRIFPASYLYFSAILVFTLFHFIPVNFSYLVTCLVMCRNYYAQWHTFNAGWWFTNHFWSLSIEEHFYLFLPGFLVFVRSRRVRTLGLLAFAFLLWSLIVRAAFPSLDGPLAIWRTDLRINSLLIPAALAVWISANRDRAAAYFNLPNTLLLIAPLAAFHEFVGRPLHLLLQVFALPFWLGWLIASTSLNSSSLLTRCLEWAPLRYVGRISFSVYLWQQVFFVGHFSPQTRPLGVLHNWPWNLFATLSLASATYYTLERPLIRLGHRLAPPVTDGRGEFAPAQPAPQVEPDAVPGFAFSAAASSGGDTAAR